MSARDKSIWEAIEAGTFKQARALIAKAQKKSPNNLYYSALTATVSALSGSHEEALKEAQAVMAQDPSDQQTVMMLSNIFHQLNRKDLLLPLFEGYAKKNPQPTQLEVWLWAMVETGNTYGQQRAAMALSKVEKSRRSNMWAVYGGLVALEDKDAVPQKERAIISMLSQRMCESVQPFISAEEVYVYARLLRVNGKNEEAVALLQTDAFRWNNLELTIMLREFLKADERWQDLFEHSRKVLVEQDLDDWAHWATLNESAEKIGKLEEASAVIKAYKATRNSLLAAVDLSVREKSGFKDAIAAYWTKMGTKKCAYDDLRSYLESKSESELAELIPDFNTTVTKPTLSESIRLVNVEKLRMLVGDVSDDDKFVTRQIALYHSCDHLLQHKDVKDYHVADDFLLVATMSLLAQSQQDGDNFQKKAIVLLEMAVARDKHQFYVRLWLVRLYLLCGCFTAAQGHYSVLSIKTIQHDTSAYFLLTRASTLFPNSHMYVTKALSLYPENDQESPMLIHHAYNHSTFSKISGFVEFKRRLDYSQTRAILTLEDHRISEVARSTGATQLRPTDELHDNRDYDSMWSIHKEGQVPFGDRYTIGPRQDDHWVEAFTLRQGILNKLGLANFEGRVELLQAEISEENAKSFTEVELWQLRAVLLLAQVALNKSKKEPFQKLASALDEFNLPADQGAGANWKFLHTAYTIVETCQNVKKYLTGLRANRIKCDKSGLDDLYKKCTDVLEEMKKAAGEMKNQRSQSREADVEALGEWALNLAKVAPERFEDVIEGIYVSRDKSLTVLRVNI